jgi:hypothetical protein
MPLVVGRLAYWVLWWLPAWREDYNGERPHGSLENMTPEEFAQRGGNLPSTGSDERPNDTANGTPEEGPKLRLTG